MSPVNNCPPEITGVYNDLACPLIVRTTGTGRPALATFVGTILQYKFDVGDYAEIEATEILHGWVEGSNIELHVHWATGGLNDATARGVKWEIEYGWANYQGAGGTVVFATTTQSVETSIAANEAAFTHKYTSVYTFTPTGGKIGSQLLLRLKRIASVTNVAPAVNPFGLSVGVHYKVKTLGSAAIP